MIIQCTNCSRKFRLDDDKIQPPGAKVRCSRCGEIFYVKVSNEKDDSDVQLEFGGNNPFEDSSPLEKETETEKVYDADSIANMIQDGISLNASQEETAPEEDNTTAEIKSDEEKEENQQESDQKVREEIDGVAGAEAISRKYEDDTVSKDTGDYETPQEFRPFNSTELSVDRDVLQRTYPETSGKRTSPGQREPVHLKRYKSGGGGFLNKLFLIFFTVVVVLTLFVSGTYVLAELGVIEKEQFNNYKGKLLSYVPANLTERDPSGLLAITDVDEKWIDSRYGQVFMVSGKVRNNSGNTINHIKLKSEYYSVDEKLYELEFYAGNTLTLKEVKNMPFESLKQKLNRKSGDVNYDDINTLAGLNFGIKPGNSVPFYTIFPSKSRILGLDYDVRVTDYKLGERDSK